MDTKAYIQRLDIEAEDAESTSFALKKDLSRLLKPGSVVLDIGANRGQFALELLEVIKDAKIFSFEPVKQAFQFLQNLSQTHKQIIPIESAVSENTGETFFYITESDVGSSLLEPLPGQPSKWLTLSNKVKVQTTRLDDFIRLQNLNSQSMPVNLLKIDAQGADLEVIRSAGDFLNPNHIESILVEMNFQIFYDSERPFHEIFNVLDNHGYRPGQIYPHRNHDEWLWWADVLFISK